MGGGGKGGGGGGGDTTVRFAPYMEEAHQQLLNHWDASSETGDSLVLSVFTAMNEAVGQSPYGNDQTVSASDGFLGGLAVTSFPSLFDTFVNFISGVDIDLLWSAAYENSVQGTEIQDAINAESEILQDEIETRILPKFLTGYRDLNAVQASSFVIGQALIGESKVKTLGKSLSDMKLHQINLAQERWKVHIDWNRTAVAMYADVMKMFYSASFDEQARSMEYSVKDRLWDLSLFEYGRAMVGALNGAAAARPDLQPSQAAKSIAGVMAGAGAGAQIGSSINSESGAGWGAAGGGLLGLAASFV